MAAPIEHAWDLLKQVSFEDVAPLPELIDEGSPSQLPDGRKPAYARDMSISEEEFRNRFMKPGTLGYTHGDFDEAYMYDQLYPALHESSVKEALGRQPPSQEDPYFREMMESLGYKF